MIMFIFNILVAIAAIYVGLFIIGAVVCFTLGTIGLTHEIPIIGPIIYWLIVGGAVLGASICIPHFIFQLIK